MRDGKMASNVATWDMTDTLIVFFLAGVNRAENAAQSVCAYVGIELGVGASLLAKVSPRIDEAPR